MNKNVVTMVRSKSLGSTPIIDQLHSRELITSLSRSKSWDSKSIIERLDSGELTPLLKKYLH